MTDDLIDIDAPLEEPEVPALAPTYAPSPTIETAIRAFAAGPRTELRLIELEGSRGEGKFNLLHDLLLTPTGWIRVGDVRPGDMVIAGDGSKTEVLGVFPQPAQQLWKLKFSDGAEIVTSDDHLWSVETKWDRDGHIKVRPSRAQVNPAKQTTPRAPRRRLKVVSTQVIRELIQGGAWKSGGRWSIPLVGPVLIPSCPVPLDPYVLGVLLGAGDFPDCVLVTSADIELISEITVALPTAVIRHKDRYTWWVDGVWKAIVALGLAGNRAWERFVPDRYLWNDPDVRLAVLQGLLDTDGTILKHSNSVSYSTTSERLAEGVEFLVRSLGGLAVRRMRQTHYWYKGERKTGRESYHISIRLPNSLAPFRVTRKANLVSPKGPRNSPRRFIVGVEPAGFDGGVCILIAHPSHLYVATEQFIVTHNTTAAIWACVALAERVIADGQAKALPVQVAVIRDTWVNIKRTTINAFHQTRAKGAPLEFADQEHEAIMFGAGGLPLVHFYFFGLDRPDQADNLQGFQCAVLWLEEIAPAATMSAGIPAEALGLGVTSVRQEGIPGRILLTFNPPPPDHWVTKIEETLEAVGMTANIKIARFKIEPGEKSAHFRQLAAEATTEAERKAWTEAADVFDAYRQRNAIFLRAVGREDLVTRLVGGERGHVQEGEALVKSFSRRDHVPKQPLQILAGHSIVRAWDAGLTPSVVWAQCGEDWINILGSRRHQHGGMNQLIMDHVIPFQKKYELTQPKRASAFGTGSRGGFTFEDIGDPACFHGSQSNSEESAARVIEAHLGTFLQPGPQDWAARREAIRTAFWRKSGTGKRMFILIDPDENEELILSLEGRAHFPKDQKTGRIVETVEALKKNSGQWFQILDALGYLLALKYPADEWLRARLRENAPRVPELQSPSSWIDR